MMSVQIENSDDIENAPIKNRKTVMIAPTKELGESKNKGEIQIDPESQWPKTNPSLIIKKDSLEISQLLQSTERINKENSS